MAETKKVALFIDAENASPAHIGAFISHCRKLGKTSIARCYGDSAALQKWKATISEWHLMPMQTPPGSSKPNATDFALTIDATSLLHRNLFDHAVIASSDADFIQLAMHIRELGRGVDCIVKSKATQEMRRAFDNVAVMTPLATSAKVATVEPFKEPPPPQQPDHKAELHSTFKKLSTSGRVTLATFGKAFKQDHPGIELGKGKLKKSLLAIGMHVSDDLVVTKT